MYELNPFPGGLGSKHGFILNTRASMNQRSDGGIYGKISELPDGSSL